MHKWLPNLVAKFWLPNLVLYQTVYRASNVESVSRLWRYPVLAHWGRVMHIYISKLTIIGLDNGLPPGRWEAIIWTNAGILLIGPWEQTWVKYWLILTYFHSWKCIWKCRLQKRESSCFSLQCLQNYIVTSAFADVCYLMADVKAKFFL